MSTCNGLKIRLLHLCMCRSNTNLAHILKKFKIDYSVTKTEILLPKCLALFSDYSHSLSTYYENVARHKYTHLIAMFPPRNFMLPVTTGYVLDMFSVLPMVLNVVWWLLYNGHSKQHTTSNR